MRGFSLFVNRQPLVWLYVFFLIVEQAFARSKRRPREMAGREVRLRHRYDYNNIMDCEFIRDDINKFYNLGQFIAGGASGLVHKAYRKSDGSVFAIKIINKDHLEEKALIAVENEVYLLKQVDHPNIVKLFEMYQNDHEFHLVMEMMQGGELIDRIIEKEYYSEVEAKKVILPIVDALRYLHAQNIIHRDLKPENILYQSTEVDAVLKLADFGMSKIVVHKEFMTSNAGTPGYWAPEVITHEQKGYDIKADYWSLGIILYILLCGEHPFNQQLSDQQQNQLIRQGKISFESEEWDSISNQAKDLIRHLIEVDPTKRYGVDQILKHPWIKEEKNRSEHLLRTTKKLQQYNKYKKLKKAKIALDFLNRLENIVKKQQYPEKTQKSLNESIRIAHQRYNALKSLTTEKDHFMKRLIKKAESKTYE